MINKGIFKKYAILLIFVLVMFGWMIQDIGIKNKAAISLDSVFRGAFFNEDNSKSSSSKLTHQVYNMTTYKILNVDSNYYEIEITYPNLGKYLYSVNLNNFDFTSDVSTENIVSMLESGAVEMITEKIRVEIIDDKPEINDALVNAYSGGLLSALTDAIDQRMTEHTRNEVDQ